MSVLSEPGIPIPQKFLLTIEEASAYTNIGKDSIKRLLSEPGCPFVIYVGPTKRLVKREAFEEFLRNTDSIE